MSDKPTLRYDEKVLDALNKFEWMARELPLRFFGDDALSTVCKSVNEREFGTTALNAVVKALSETITKYRAQTGTGRGIAANQLGFTKRVIVVWLGDQPEAFINPKLISSVGLGSYWESCMSSGSLLIGEVHRPWTGVFEYQDVTGQTHQIDADEKQTRLFLHEMDHLDGRICSERYEPNTTRFVRGGKEEVLGYPFKRLK